ncbi:microtubule-associated protein family, partial [Trichomonas vaginalis G3]|uniref:microtubule-associated protein family n=1 Tax=Trichomonas vaginalis (strain ATCC PRA-98 / G3) TaxID=412133 RepID=UPI0021E5E5A8
MKLELTRLRAKYGNETTNTTTQTTKADRKIDDTPTPTPPPKKETPTPTPAMANITTIAPRVPTGEGISGNVSTTHNITEAANVSAVEQPVVNVTQENATETSTPRQDVNNERPEVKEVAKAYLEKNTTQVLEAEKHLNSDKTPTPTPEATPTPSPTPEASVPPAIGGNIPSVPPWQKFYGLFKGANKVMDAAENLQKFKNEVATGAKEIEENDKQAAELAKQQAAEQAKQQAEATKQAAAPKQSISKSQRQGPDPSAKVKQNPTPPAAEKSKKD